MAYTPLAAALIVSAANANRETDRIWDIGMPTYGGYAHNERFALIDSYAGGDGEYDEALDAYQVALAHTVGLVCVGREVQTEDDSESSSSRISASVLEAADSAVIEPELLTRGIIAVTRKEMGHRIGTEEARFLGKKGNRRRFMGSLAKEGPAEAIAKQLGYEVRPCEIDNVTNMAYQGMNERVSRRVAAVLEEKPNATYLGTSLTVIRGIVKAQADLERGVYRELPVEWPLNKQ